MGAGDFAPKCLEQTRLLVRLKQPFADPSSAELALKLAQVLVDICKIAADRMKLMPALHGEFTLHDEVHLLRVTELMAKVMPERVLSNVLNPVEIALLILSAYFHDSGMIPDREEAERIRQSGEYQLARQNWLIEFAGFSDALRILENKDTADEDRDRPRRIVAEFEQAVFARFVRDKHAEFSSDLVKKKLGGDDRLRVGTGHLADSLALLCVSHNLPPESITDAQGFHYDKAVGTFAVNLAYLATVLRLADILDFDRERTPDELYRSISFTNPISIHEWEKHRQVEGWKIDRDAVRFECACERPEYEHTIRRFLRFIDDELAAAHDLVRRFPAPFIQYAIDLPARTDGSRVQARDGAYLYAGDLEISLNRDEIVRLLMTEKLYGHPSLAIRELLQNAWDALRHRRAIMKRDDGVDWSGGHVEFEHGVNEHGREFVRCVDNGVGMDQRIVKDFLVRAGRSYYRSPEFERERLSFAKASADFDPCARFGIGFMSLFMLGDQIVIHTRRYGGSSGGLGEPLIVEINGLDSLIVLRRGAEAQPRGTSVLVIGRRKPDRFATWNDRVRLVDTLYAYALAGEFPVSARCSIAEIEDAIEIPTKMAEPWHPLVEFNVKNRAVFEQDFSEVDPRLRGKVACGVPLSDEGALVVANSEAGWRQGEGRHGADFFIAAADKQKFQVWTWEGRTCLDGILVAGPHGRGRRGFLIVGSQYRNPIGFGQDLFVLDVRGDLKPELSPDRAPPDTRGVFRDEGPSWRRLRRIAGQAHGKLWKKVIERFGSEKDAKALWQLMALHDVPVSTLPRGFIWSRFFVPSIANDGSLFFRTFSQLGAIPFDVGSAKPFAAEKNGCRVGVDAEMDAWHSQNNYKLVSPVVRSVVLSMATLALEEGRPVLELHPPEQPDELGFTHILFDRIGRSLSTIPFGRGLEGVLAGVTSERLLNKRHPIAAFLLSQQERAVDEPEFLFLNCLAGAVLEDGALEALANADFSNRRVNVSFSGLGFYYRNVDIAALKPEHRPPYRCWLPEKGMFQITEDTLAELAQVQAIDWHRREEPRVI
jgi:hypothetical protein